MGNKRHQVLAKAHMTLNVDGTWKPCDKALPLAMRVDIYIFAIFKLTS